MWTRSVSARVTHRPQGKWAGELQLQQLRSAGNKETQGGPRGWSVKITPGDDSTGPSRLRGSGREQREEPAGQGTGVFWGRRSEIEGNPGVA